MILDKIERFRENLPPRQVPLFEQIMTYMARSPHDGLARIIEQEIEKEEPDAEHVRELLDELERVLVRFHMPLSTQAKAFERDREAFFWMMRSFLDEGRLDGVRDNMQFYWALFDATGKTLCGALRSRCRYANQREFPDRNCMHRFAGDSDRSVICPKCGAVRMLCRQNPKPNGYCHFHGGRKSRRGGDEDGEELFLRGDTIYGRQLTGDLRKHFRAFQKDPNFLSVLPEMNLLRANIADYAGKLNEFDPDVIKGGLAKSLDRLQDALDDHDHTQAYDALAEANAWLTQAQEGGRAGDKMEDSIMKLVRAAEAERRRVVDAKQMIPRQEAAALVDDFIRELDALLEDFALDGFNIFRQAMQRHFPKQSSNIQRKMTEIDIQGKLIRAMSQRLSDALLRAEEADHRARVRQQQKALAEGEWEVEGDFEEVFEGEEDG